MKKNNVEKICQNRRQFLVKSTATASGIILSLTGLERVTAQKNDPDDVTLRLDEKSPLNSIGGTLSFDYKGDKIIVLRKSETDFIAFSAFCPHQGGVVTFNSKTQQFVCPLHNSKFDPDGQRISGPARQSLASFPTQNAIVVSLKL